MDVMTTDRWLEVIENKRPSNFFQLFLYLAALQGTKSELEYHFNAYPNLAEAIQIKENSKTTIIQKMNRDLNNKNAKMRNVNEINALQEERI